MRLILWICVLMCLPVMGFGQTNPFDLNHKLPESEQRTNVTTTPRGEKTKKKNKSLPITEPKAIKPKEIIPETDPPKEEIVDNGSSDAEVTNDISFDEVAKDKLGKPMVPDTSQVGAEPIVHRNYFNSMRDNQVFRLWYIPLMAIFLAFVINMDRYSIGKLIKSVTNLNYLNLMYRDQRNRYRPQYILYSILFVLSASYFVKQALGYLWDIDISIFMTCLIIGGIYLTRHLMMALISYAFPGNSEINQYSYNIFIFNIILGMLLLLVNLFVAFSPSTIARLCLLSGVGLIAGMYLFRLSRGFLLSSNLILKNKFRFFMYLCTLEIAPIFLIISIFRQF